MKRLGTMLLAVLMLVSLLPMYAVAEQRDVDLSGTFDDIVWTLTGSTYEVENEYGEIEEYGDLILTIGGSGNMIHDGGSYIAMPWDEYASYIERIIVEDGVTSIGTNAFRGCNSATSVELPDSLLLIGESAFRGCSLLTSITIPDSVKQIYKRAFSGCVSLTTIALPEALISIGESAFSYCTSLTSVAFSNEVTSIGNYAFESCTSLTSLTIPGSVTSLGENAFLSCYELTDIFYGGTSDQWESLEYWQYEDDLFSARVWFEYSKFEDGKLCLAGDVADNSQYSWSEHADATEVIHIHSGVTSIPSGAYSGFGNVAICSIPNTVEKIASNAFENCDSLTDVYYSGSEAEWKMVGYSFPDSVKMHFNSVLEETWYILDGVLTVTAEYDPYISDPFNEEEYLRSSAPWSEYWEIVTDVIIEEGVVALPDYAFQRFFISTVTIPGSIKEFGICTFTECTKLKTVIIEEGVTSTGAGTFSFCSSLNSVILPESLETIEGDAFSFCGSLKSIEIPDGVRSIGSNAFLNCVSLERVILPDGNIELIIPDVAEDPEALNISSHAFLFCFELKDINLPGDIQMALEMGGCNVLFLNGYHGLSLDSKHEPQDLDGRLYQVVATSAVAHNKAQKTIVSNELKLLFTQYFAELFSVTEDGVVLTDPELVQELIWFFTNGQKITDEWQKRCEEITALVKAGRVVPDIGYTIPLSDTEEVLFSFAGFDDPNDDAFFDDYFAYRVCVQPIGETPDYENAGEVSIDKYISDDSAYLDSGIAQVELTAQGETYNVPTDIVLVMDVSSSMKGKVDAYNYDDISVTKIYAAREAAKEFVTMVTRPNNRFNENRIAVVEFFDYAHVVQEMTHIRNQDELDDLTKKIQDMNYVVGGGTNYDDPLKVAGNILEAAKNEDGYGNRKQVVIFMTDGAPGIYNRACPFYFEVYGEFPEREDSAEKFVELRKDVALDISDYFWQTGSPLDTKYTNVLRSLIQEIYGEQYTRNITYCPGDSTLEGYDSYGKDFTNFLNSYWYKYVMGTLTESDFKGIDLAYQRVDAPEPIEADEPWEDGESKKYLLVADINEKPYVLSTVSSIDVDSLPTEDGYPYYIGPNGQHILLNEESMTRLYPYFAPITMNAVEGATERCYISIDDAKYGNSIGDFTMTCTDATARTGIDGTFFLRADYGRWWSTWLRTKYGTVGYGVNSDMPGGLYYTEDGDLYNHNTNPWGEPAYFFYPNLNADSEYYLEITKTDPNVGYYFMEQVEVDMDMIPVELETHMADDNIFNKRLKGTATQEQLDTWGIEGEALNAQVYTVGFALNTNSTIDDPAGPGYLYFNSEQSFALLDQMASDGSALRADDMEGLYKAYSTIAEELVGVPVVATIRDTMGDAFDLQTAKTVNTENGTKEISVEPTVAFGYYKLDENGGRTGEFQAIEIISFGESDAGFSAISDVLGSDVNCYDAAANAISGAYIQYDMTDEMFTVEEIILDSGKQFVLNYWVHLSGSSEGMRPAGIYDTNREATLSYSDKEGKDCELVYPVPQLSWGDAVTQIEYYLVNTKGEPVNWSNQVIPFEDRIIVDVHDPFGFMLESTKRVDGNAFVPKDYEMYNSQAYYSVFAAANGTGRLILNDATETTYLVQPSLSNGNGSVDNLSDYTNTRIAFAVVYDYEAPVTGDPTSMGLWLALLAISGAGLALLVYRRRKMQDIA